ncbi:alpha/beta fold hydrolase [Deinococcus cavernae]|uniref:Alpha/beta fold hydrolase n=1 Tax=Deinococcus cavernae TaxID=2320857 RepID=A0A418V4Q4_9DEIO|nr:alpha/beta fold hydrolase [Deinococcus cavernae]RJF71052.1 alpha/beta fold hydrolase [Deinococcus cavernae]
MEVHSFQQGGMKLHYRSTGRGDPIVLIHGLSGSAGWWRYNVPVLALKRRVYLLDLVGYGHGRRQKALGVEGDVQLLSAWMEALNLQGAALIGHSMGGHLALRLAEQQPERVSHLVLACASGLLKGPTWRMALRLPQAGLTGRRSFLPRILFDSGRAGLPNLWRSGVGVLADDVRPRLAQVKARTLVIWGERDVVIPSRLGRALADGIPGAQYLEIPRAGHVVMVDAPRQFNRAVLTFLHEGQES